MAKRKSQQWREGETEGGAAVDEARAPELPTRIGQRLDAKRQGAAEIADAVAGALDPSGGAAADPRAERPEYRTVPLECLRESATNPRRHFNEKKIAEYAESMQRVGVIQPLLVRPVSDNRGHWRPRLNAPMEIVCGACRYRAAKLAGLIEVPCTVREIDDAAMLQIQIIENCQRDDVHPLDEADGFTRLVKADWTAEQIAARVGKSETYVRQRLQLCKLIEPAKELIWAEKITPEHGKHLARLRPEDQTEALAACKGWQSEYHGVAHLVDWIRRNVLLDLSGAPWKKDDAALCAEAGACTSCQKRSGYCPALFADIGKKDVCLDRKCFHAKQAAFVERKKTTVPAGTLLMSSRYGKDVPAGAVSHDRFYDANKKTQGAVPALMVDGVEAGKIVYVQPIPGLRAGGAKSSEAEKRAAERERRKRQIETAQREAILLAALEKLPLPLGARECEAICARMLSHLSADARRAFAKALALDLPKKVCYGDELERDCAEMVAGMDGPRLSRVAVGALYADALGECYGDYAKKRLAKLARDYGIDTAAVAKKAAAEFEAAHPAKAQGKTDGKPGAKKAGRSQGARGTDPDAGAGAALDEAADDPAAE